MRHNLVLSLSLAAALCLAVAIGSTFLVDGDKTINAEAGAAETALQNSSTSQKTETVAEAESSTVSDNADLSVDTTLTAVARPTAATVKPRTKVADSPTKRVDTTAKSATSKSPVAKSPAAVLPLGTKNQLLAALNNPDPKFSQFADVAEKDIDLDRLVVPTPPISYSNVEGQFRILCQYSHFNYDDPIVKPGQPEAAHLHMYFGNTRVNHATTQESLVNSGGGTCQGFEANRTGYWMPALLDGKGNAVVPDTILVYYKSTKIQGQPEADMPQGLKMVAGNTANATFEPDFYLQWNCGTSAGVVGGVGNTIVACGDTSLQAVISFPNCWDGQNLDSPDHRSHMALAHATPCPKSHPVRLPLITYKIFWPGTTNVEGWKLSSDGESHRGAGGTAGSSLHADWFGGWNNAIMKEWTQGCILPAGNCSQGVMGSQRQLAKVSNLNTYGGENFLRLPEGAEPASH